MSRISSLIVICLSLMVVTERDRDAGSHGVGKRSAVRVAHRSM